MRRLLIFVFAAAALACAQTPVILTGSVTARFSDGSNTVAIKPASAPAAAADPAMVVSVSPNSPLPAGTNTIGATKRAGDSSVLSGQQAVTASAVALTSNASRGVCVKAFAGNSINVYIGPSGVSTSTGMELAPGDSVCLPVTNTNLLYLIASSTGASVSWIATY